MVGAAGVDASGPGAAVAAEADRVAQVPGPSGRWVLVALGVVLAAMNSLFYLAVDRLPLSTVGAIEFLGTVVLAVAGARTRRNLFALVVAVGGVFALTDIRLVAEPLGFAFAFANCAVIWSLPEGVVDVRDGAVRCRDLPAGRGYLLWSSTQILGRFDVRSTGGGGRAAA